MSTFNPTVKQLAEALPVSDEWSYYPKSLGTLSIGEQQEHRMTFVGVIQVLATRVFSKNRMRLGNEVHVGNIGYALLVSDPRFSPEDRTVGGRAGTLCGRWSVVADSTLPDSDVVVVHRDPETNLLGLPYGISMTQGEDGIHLVTLHPVRPEESEQDAIARVGNYAARGRITDYPNFKE